MPAKMKRPTLLQVAIDPELFEMLDAATDNRREYVSGVLRHALENGWSVETKTVQTVTVPPAPKTQRVRRVKR